MLKLTIRNEYSTGSASDGGDGASPGNNAVFKSEVMFNVISSDSSDCGMGPNDERHCEVFHNPGRIARDHYVRRNVSRDDRPRADDDSIADGHAFQYDSASADPNLIPNDHRPYRFRRRRLPGAPPGGIQRMAIMVLNLRPPGDQAVAADLNRTRHTEITSVAHE